jgi:hypothetical protein
MWGVVETPNLIDMETFSAETISAHIQTVQGGSGLSAVSVDMESLMQYLESMD